MTDRCNPCYNGYGLHPRWARRSRTRSCNPCYNGYGLHPKDRHINAGGSCNPCYNGYGLHPYRERGAIGIVVILVIMDTAYTRVGCKYMWNNILSYNSMTKIYRIRSETIHQRAFFSFFPSRRSRLLRKQTLCFSMLKYRTLSKLRIFCEKNQFSRKEIVSLIKIIEKWRVF